MLQHEFRIGIEHPEMTQLHRELYVFQLMLLNHERQLNPARQRLRLADP